MIKDFNYCNSPKKIYICFKNVEILLFCLIGYFLMFVFFMFPCRYLLSCNMLYFLYVHDKYKVIKIIKRFDICGKNKLIINQKISLCLNVPMACDEYKNFSIPYF